MSIDLLDLLFVDHVLTKRKQREEKRRLKEEKRLEAERVKSSETCIKQALHNLEFVFDSPRPGDVFISPIWMEDPENPSEKIKIGSLYVDRADENASNAKIVSDRPRSELKSGAFWMQSQADPAIKVKLGEIDL